MDCSVTNLGDVVLVAAAGRIDLSNADSFKDTLSEALSHVPTAIIVPVSGLFLNKPPILRMSCS